MPQIRYTVEFDRILPLKSLTELCKRLYDLLSKGNSRTFKHFDQKTAVFQGFQGLEKTVMNFKYFQALQGPVRTLSKTFEKQIHFPCLFHDYDSFS